MTQKFIGLSQKDAEKKLRDHGYNEIKELIHVSPVRILLRQIKKNFILYLLLSAAIISFLVGKIVTSYTISGVIVVVITVGFFQEYKAEKAIKALKQLIISLSTVIRNGKEIQIPSREIVRGDIIILRSGEKVPADCLILNEKELRVDESVLTGESREIKKFSVKNEKNYKKENQIFMGTHIVNGKCIAKVLCTGMSTEFGKIAEMISTAEKELPLQKKINDIAKYMVFIAIVSSLLIGAIMLLRTPISNEVLVDVLIVVIALSVSAFPEGFPVVLISTLASGSYRMAKKNAIVNRMSIIETLGETTVICSDKTGTITKGEMTAKHVFCNDIIFDISGVGYEHVGSFLYKGKKVDMKSIIPLKFLLKSAVLCNDASIEKIADEKEYKVQGTPTEISLLVMSSKAGVFKEDFEIIRKNEIPFNSERKIMSTFYKEGEKYFVYTKGAPEMVVHRCNFIQKNNKIVKLSDSEKKKILNVNRKFASKGFRTLAIAYKKTNSKDTKHFEKNLVFLGIAALEDPPREEVKHALKLCRYAGINVKMITGDNKDTAISIANEIGLKGGVLSGEEIDKMSDEKLSDIVKKTGIFVRVKPSHKMRIVSALKSNGEIVTMTGDGVNDAPALKEAHIGVAMGTGGTDVSREVADMTIKDDNFATIVSAIGEGRTIFNNIQKFVTYQLSCNYSEILIILLGVMLGLPLPLLALQILFMNLVTDNLPALMLGFNPSSSDIMKNAPRRKSSILNKQLISLLIIAGSIMGVVTLGVFYFSLNFLGQDVITARTTTLLTLIFFEIANAFNFRSFRKYVLNRSPFVNKYLVYASLASILATAAIIYSPLNTVFEVTPIGLPNILLAVITSLIIICVFDFLKLIKGDLSQPTKFNLFSSKKKS